MSMYVPFCNIEEKSALHLFYNFPKSLWSDVTTLVFFVVKNKNKKYNLQKLSLFVCVCVCVYIYIYIHTHTHTHTHIHIYIYIYIYIHSKYAMLIILHYLSSG